MSGSALCNLHFGTCALDQDFKGACAFTRASGHDARAWPQLCVAPCICVHVRVRRVLMESVYMCLLG